MATGVPPSSNPLDAFFRTCGHIESQKMKLSSISGSQADELVGKVIQAYAQARDAVQRQMESASSPTITEDNQLRIIEEGSELLARIDTTFESTIKTLLQPRVPSSGATARAAGSAPRMSQTEVFRARFAELLPVIAAFDPERAKRSEVNELLEQCRQLINDISPTALNLEFGTDIDKVLLAISFLEDHIQRLPMSEAPLRSVTAQRPLAAAGTSAASHLGELGDRARFLIAAYEEILEGALDPKNLKGLERFLRDISQLVSDISDSSRSEDFILLIEQLGRIQGHMDLIIDQLRVTDAARRGAPSTSVRPQGRASTGAQVGREASVRPPNIRIPREYDLDPTRSPAPVPAAAIKERYETILQKDIKEICGYCMPHFNPYSYATIKEWLPRIQALLKEMDLQERSFSAEIRVLQDIEKTAITTIKRYDEGKRSGLDRL
jgi:hypothetical protein